MLQLAFLAPNIIAAIFGGRQPADLAATMQKRVGQLPADWDAQRKRLGFAG